MNSRLMKTSLILISVTALSFAGFAQEAQAPAGDNAAMQPAGDNAAMQPAAGEQAAAPEAAPAPDAAAPAAPAPAEGGCPAGGCEVPLKPDAFRVIQLPDERIVEAEKVEVTGEQRQRRDTTIYNKNIYIEQPSRTEHTISDNTNYHTEYNTKKIYQPSHRRIVIPVETACQSNQVNPCTEEVQPLKDLGCAIAEQPACPTGCPIQ